MNLINAPAVHNNVDTVRALTDILQLSIAPASLKIATLESVSILSDGYILALIEFQMRLDEDAYLSEQLNLQAY